MSGGTSAAKNSSPPKASAGITPDAARIETLPKASDEWAAQKNGAPPSQTEGTAGGIDEGAPAGASAVAGSNQPNGLRQDENEASDEGVGDRTKHSSSSSSGPPGTDSCARPTGPNGSATPALQNARSPPDVGTGTRPPGAGEQAVASGHAPSPAARDSKAANDSGIREATMNPAGGNHHEDMPTGDEPRQSVTANGNSVRQNGQRVPSTKAIRRSNSVAKTRSNSSQIHRGRSPSHAQSVDTPRGRLPTGTTQFPTHRQSRVPSAQDPAFPHLELQSAPASARPGPKIRRRNPRTIRIFHLHSATASNDRAPTGLPHRSIRCRHLVIPTLTTTRCLPIPRHVIMTVQLRGT